MLKTDEDLITYYEPSEVKSESEQIGTIAFFYIFKKMPFSVIIKKLHFKFTKCTEMSLSISWYRCTLYLYI